MVKYRDNSVVVKQDGYGVVDKVFSDSYNSIMNNYVKFVSVPCEPLGDKFANVMDRRV